MAFLDWTKTGDAGDPEPCVLCGRPAICRSPKGRPCHKTCAEAWLDAAAERRRQAGDGDEPLALA